MGFLNIYEFFVETQKYQWDRELDEAARQDRSYFAKELFRLAGHDLLVAKKTIDFYCELLGAEAGNLVLKTMATGGLYLSGGVTKHLLPYLEESNFYQRFTAKGRFKDLLSHIPIIAVTDRHVGIKGAALRALK
jgi:glucokinase